MALRGAEPFILTNAQLDYFRGLHIDKTHPANRRSKF